jgi:hypothetical protein
VNSQLFERLLLSNDVAAVLAVARQEKPPTEARDIVKDPMVLAFLGLKREAGYHECDLETALVTHLQESLRELGNDKFPHQDLDHSKAQEQQLIVCKVVKWRVSLHQLPQPEDTCCNRNPIRARVSATAAASGSTPCTSCRNTP